VAKRIFQIAKELEVKSKAIVEKCKAEDIPGINNHMSSVSAGLEATIREWFSGASSESGSETGTAVQSSAAVDLEKVRSKSKAVHAKARKAKPKPKAAPAEEVAKAPEPETPEKAPEPAATPEPQAQPHPGPEPEVKPASQPEPEAQAETPAPDESPAEPPVEEARPAAEAPGAGDQGEPGDEKPAAPPAMNVPTRPKVVAPAGPRLEATKPAKLSGPKVVRVEAPERVEAPRRRRPAPSPAAFGGGGAGMGAPADAPPGAPGGRGGSPRRNKRRRGGGDDREGGGGYRTQDLIEREQRLSRAPGMLRQRRRQERLRQLNRMEKPATLAETGGTVKIQAPLTIKDLSAATGVKASDIIKKLFLQGVMATVNSPIEVEQAEEVMIDWEIELEVEQRASAEEVVEQEFAQRDMVDERQRSPVATILGHVDHGKTSLLDRIRKAKVAEGEAGGITQATSAFRVPLTVGGEEKNVVFLDTPGHEAFTSMRARGATVTDIVVLVVAADDGVMPQTIESINHSKAAGVPIVVALNKIDKAEATDSNIQRILGQLAEHDLNPAEWGGTTEVVRVSAETGDGIDELLEVLDYQAQLLDIKADFGGSARGTVIESQFQEGRGPVINALIHDGELKVGDFMVCGPAYGRVRDIQNDRGEKMKSAGPATPVQLSGLSDLPDAGEKFFCVDTLKKAQEAAEERRARDREKELAVPKAVTLESMLGKMKESELKQLNIIIKADVQGSVDVLKKSAEEIETDEVRVRVLHAAVGGVTESDVTLAQASQAVIIGFNVIPSAKARREAEDKNIEIRSYQVIYDIVDDLKKAAEGLLEPELREEVLGHAEVREVFRISKVGAVAGCYVTDGTIERNALIRVTRDDIVIEQNRVLEQLKRFKDDAKEVRNGQECGMKIVGYDDIKQGDILECYRVKEVKRTL